MARAAEAAASPVPFTRFIDPVKASRSAMPKKIDLIMCDFDGVITDNRVWVDQDGTETVAAYRSDSVRVKDRSR